MLHIEDGVQVSAYVCSNSSDGHKFHTGDGVQVSASIPEQYFHVEYSTANNTHHYGWPVQAGTAQVNATLEGVRDSSGILHSAPRITAVTDMLIYNKISIHPSEVVLPWDSIVHSKYVRTFLFVLNCALVE
jgi:hypothetical protein